MRPHGWPVLAVGLLMALGQSTLANTPLPEHPILHPPTGETHTDAYGDELPPLAQARLGTLRFRHGGTLGAVAISPDGKIVASGGKYARSVPWSGGWALEDDRWIRLWEAATGRQIRQIQVTENSIQCLNFSPDGRTLAVGWGDKVGLWEVATGHRLLFHGHPDEVQFVHFSADSATLASGDASGTVLLWDLATGKRVRSWKPERDWLPRRDKNAPEVFRSVAFSPDGQWLAWGIMRWKKWTDNSYVAEGTIYRLVRAADGQLLHQWEEPDSHGRVVFSSDSRLLATGADTIRLWDTVCRTKIQEITGLSDSIDTLVFAPNSRVLVSGHNDGTVCLWDVQTGKKLREYSDASRVLSLPDCQVPLAFSADSKILVEGVGGTVRLLDWTTGKDIPSLEGHRQPISHLQFSSDGQTLVSGDGQTCCRWRSRTWKQLSCWSRLPGNEDCLAESPDGSLFLQQTDLDSVELREGTTGKLLCRWKKEEKVSYRTGLFSPDGRRVVLVEEKLGLVSKLGMPEVNPAIIHLYEVPTGKEVRRMILPEWVGSSLAFSLDGHLLAWVGVSGTLFLEDMTTGGVVRKLKKVFAGSSLVNAPQLMLLVFSPDGEYLAEARKYYSPVDEDREGAIPFQIVIWQVQTGKEVQRLAVREEDGRPSRLACLAFSADSRTLITGQRGETALRLWEVASGQERGRFEGHVDSVLALAVSPDGKKLASGSEDGTVLIWDLEGSTQEKPAYQPNLTVRQLASLWTDLAGQDGARAREAILKFTHAPRQSVPFLKEHLPPVRSIRTEQMGRWLADLDSPRFAARAEATRALEDLQEAAEPGLHRVLREDPSPEVRGRVEQLLQELHQLVPSGERLQALRAVETLEHIATPEARQVLEQVASGLPEARLTQEARAALKRLREP